MNKIVSVQGCGTVLKSLAVLVFTFLCLGVWSAHAATLSLTPNTGVYTAGQTFTARVVINTQGASINAADAVLTYNPSELTVVSVSQAGSIFNLWAEEPSFTPGRIVFGGGAPRGYTGAAGTVMTITFRATSAGTKRVNFQSGSVLAADGQGTNVLTNMNGATYTISAQESTPEPEVIQYVPLANTPQAPVVRSATHPDSDGWYQSTTAELQWTIPSGVTQVRTLLDQNPNSVPSRVYETPISSITLDDLPNGVSYFHIQFRNSEGWGSVGRYRLAVSTQAPTGVTISLAEDTDRTNPQQSLHVNVEESMAPIVRAVLQINGGEPVEFELTGASSTIALPELEPGYHTVVAEVFDAAGNSQLASVAFTIESFEAPLFIDLPREISADVIPVFRGQTRPRAEVYARLRSVANDTVREYRAQADDEGFFLIIPETTLAEGVYELSATAQDQYGAKSARSEAHRFAVQQPGYLRIGTLLVSVLSVLVPLIGSVALLVLLLWYTWYRIRRLRRRVLRESSEAHDVLIKEFSLLESLLSKQTEQLSATRKTKQLTKAEVTLVSTMREQLAVARKNIEKEIVDVEVLVPQKQRTKKNKR